MKSIVFQVGALAGLLVLLAGCGGTGSASDSTPTPSATLTEAPTSTPTPAPAQPTSTSTPGLPSEQLSQYRPNELGQVPILQYHHFGNTPDQFTRTLDQFRSDLQWLYEHDFYAVNLHDFLDNTMNVPAGKHPVILTFDDSTVSQFKVSPRPDGGLEIDPNTAIAVLERFYRDHPDFGRGGHFAVIPDRTFAWPEAPQQFEYATEKLRWLVKHGYEVGNHTMHHQNLAEASPAEAKAALAEGDLAIEEQLPDADIRVVTLPYGAYPGGSDDSIFHGFTYKGETFAYDGVLLVGANPSPSVLSTNFDPYAIPRIQAFDKVLDQWFTYFEEHPGIIYTSDGDSDTVTIPRTLDQELVGTLDETRVGDRELIRYE